MLEIVAFCAPLTIESGPRVVFSELHVHSPLEPRSGGWLEAGDVAADFGHQVLGVEAELLEHAGVALGVDLVGQVLLGLLGLVSLALLV